MPAASSARRSTISTLGLKAGNARQTDALDLAALGAADTGHVGRGAAQHDRRTGQPSDLHRHVARLVARRAVRLIGRIVLLVDDDQARVGQRREGGDARANHDLYLVGPDAPPFVGSLTLPQGAVQQRDFDAQIVLNSLEQGHRQGDLGHQHQRSPAGRQRGLDRRRVDSRLAARGRALEQHSGRAPLADELADALNRRALLGAQLRMGRPRSAAHSRAAGQGAPLDAHALDAHQAASCKSRQGARPVLGGEAGGADRGRRRRRARRASRADAARAGPPRLRR